jgi:hypothetical protein
MRDLHDSIDHESYLKTSDISDVLGNVIDFISIERDMQISLRNLHEFDCERKTAHSFPHFALANEKGTGNGSEGRD